MTKEKAPKENNKASAASKDIPMENTRSNVPSAIDVSNLPNQVATRSPRPVDTSAKPDTVISVYPSATSRLSLSIDNRSLPSKPLGKGQQIGIGITQQPMGPPILSVINDMNDPRWIGSTKPQIFGGSPYSKMLLRGDRESSDFAHSNLKFLEGITLLFFRKCKTLPEEISALDLSNKRGIWSSSGSIVFYTGLKRSFCCKGCYYTEFENEIVDSAGAPVIRAKGRQSVFGFMSSIEISLEGGKVLGTMHQSFFSSTYDIKDPKGTVIYKIQAPCFATCAPFVFWCCREHFEICMDDGVTEIGKITKYWGSEVDDALEFKSCLGIELDRADDVYVKGLLLGCFFLIEYQYYRNGGNGPLYFILMLLAFAGIIALIECAGYCPFWLHNAVERVDMI